MTHEYVIAMGGRVLGAAPGDGPAPTAIGWAADAVLAVGPDDVVRAISRGDSTFLDLAGCTVTAASSDVRLEPGAPADLDLWRAWPPGPGALPLARVRAGAFTEGDEHCGPFARVVPTR
jgi:hypothetical protein